MEGAFIEAEKVKEKKKKTDGSLNKSPFAFKEQKPAAFGWYKKSNGLLKYLKYIAVGLCILNTHKWSTKMVYKNI